MALTINNVVGFNTAATDDESDTWFGAQLSATTVRTGERSLWLQNLGNNGYYEIPAFHNADDAGNNYIVGFAFYLDSETLTQNGSPRLILSAYDSSSIAMSVYIGEKATAGVYGLVYQGILSYPLVAGSAVVSLDTWHYVDIYWEHATSGTGKFYLDNVLDVTVTNTNFMGSVSDIERYRLKGHTELNIYFDDFYCASGATSESDRLGPCKVYSHYTDKNSLVPDNAGVNYGPTNLSASGDTWVATDPDTGVDGDFALYDTGTSGGSVTIALDAGITTNPVAMTCMYDARAIVANKELITNHYGVYGNSVDGRELTRALEIGKVFNNPTGGQRGVSAETTGGLSVPQVGESLHLGFEIGTSTNDFLLANVRQSSTTGGTSITISPGYSVLKGRLAIVVITKDDDTATLTSPTNWDLLTSFSGFGQIQTEIWYKDIVNSENTSYTWTGDSEAYYATFMEVRGGQSPPVLHVTNNSDDGAPLTAAFTAQAQNSLIIGGFGLDKPGSNSIGLSATLTTARLAKTGTGAGDVASGVGYYYPGATTSIPALNHSSGTSEEWAAFAIEVKQAVDVQPMEVYGMWANVLVSENGGGDPPETHEGAVTLDSYQGLTPTVIHSGNLFDDTTEATRHTLGVTVEHNGNTVEEVAEETLHTLTATFEHFGSKFGEVTGESSHAMTATVSVISAVSDVRLTHYHFRKHLGTEAESRPMQPNDTDIDAIVDEDYMLRFMVENQGSKSVMIQYFNLQYRRNAGAWTQVSTTSTDVKCNQDAVRYISSPSFVGQVYSSPWTSYWQTLVESPAGVFHKTIYDMKNGLCQSTNLDYSRYQRSPDAGISWSNTKNLDGENYEPQDTGGDCIKGRVQAFSGNRAGDEMAVWTFGTFDPTEGDYGVILTSQTNGVSWGTQYPIDAHPSAPTVVMPNLAALSAQDDKGMMMQENGDLYLVFSGWESAWVDGAVNFDLADRASRHYLAVYKSTNYGSSYTYHEVINDYLDGFGDWDRAFQFRGATLDRDTGDLYICMEDGDDLDLWKSTTNGTSWTKISTILTATDADTVNDKTHCGLQCVTPTGDIIFAYMGKYQGAYDRAYAKLKTSTDGGVTWIDSYIGPKPPEVPYLRAGIPRVFCPLEKTGTTSALLASLPIDYRYVTSINPTTGFYDYWYTNGPTWWRSETGSVWTGPHNTRNARDGWYVTGGYANPQVTHFLIIDGRGNAHIGFGMTVAGMGGSKAHFDSEPVFNNLDDCKVNMLGGESSSSFDSTNHGFSVDGGLGPTRLHAQSKAEYEIKIRADSATVSTGDDIEFRVIGTNDTPALDVVPTMTIATTEKVWPGTTGTTVTAGAVARGRALTSVSSVSSYAKGVQAVSLPSLTSSGTSLIPKGRRFGPWHNYVVDAMYALLYTTGPTEIQFYKADSASRGSTWSAVGTTIGVGADDSVWAEQGISGYEHMIYIVIQDDTSGDVDFYEFNTSTDTMSTVVNLHSPSPAPYKACVTMALRNNGSTPQIVCGYNSERDGTFSTQRASASIRDCSGGSWTHNIIIDGRASGILTHWMHPTMVTGGDGRVHCTICVGPVDVNGYEDSIWGFTLRLDNTISTLEGIVGITGTSSNLNSDLEPPGSAGAWFRDEDNYHIRFAFCYQDTGAIYALNYIEDSNGDLVFHPVNTAIVVTDGTNTHTIATNDTANMVMISDNGDTDPHTQSGYFLFISDSEYVRVGFDEYPFLYPGYDLTLIASAPAVSRVAKVSANYLRPGGGGVYIAVLYEEPGGVLYNEWEIIEAADQGVVTHNASVSSLYAKAVVKNALGLVTFNAEATATAIAKITPPNGPVGTRIPYDPVKEVAPTELVSLGLIPSENMDYVASATARGVANVPTARGGKPVHASATSTGVATVRTSPILFLPVYPSDTPVDVLVIRGDGLEERVENQLISSIVVAIEYGRNYIDENGQRTRDTTLTVLYEDNFKSGQIISIQDSLRGTTYTGKITSVSHNVAKTEKVAVTVLEVRIPLDA